jgi:hypothetical protein
MPNGEDLKIQAKKIGKGLNEIALEKSADTEPISEELVLATKELDEAKAEWVRVGGEKLDELDRGQRLAAWRARDFEGKNQSDLAEEQRKIAENKKQEYSQLWTKGVSAVFDRLLQAKENFDEILEQEEFKKLSQGEKDVSVSLDKQLAEFDRFLSGVFEEGKKNQDKIHSLKKEAEFRTANTSYLQDVQHELKLVWDRKIEPVLSRMNKSIQSQAHGLYQNMQKALGRGEFQQTKTTEDIERLIFYGEAKVDTDVKQLEQPTKRHPVIKVLADFFTKVANIAKKGESKGGVGSIDDELGAASENLGELMIKAGLKHQKKVDQSLVNPGR